MPRLFERISRIFRKPLFGTRVIPHDARVDPAAFPEDDYPIWCPKCGYVLKGLPQDRCPECGQEFDRGRLLVWQYVFGKGRVPRKPSGPGKVARIMFATGCVLMALHFALILLVPVILAVRAGNIRAARDWISVLAQLVQFSIPLPLIALGGAAIAEVVALRPYFAKRKAIRAAIPTPNGTT